MGVVCRDVTYGQPPSAAHQAVVLVAVAAPLAVGDAARVCGCVQALLAARRGARVRAEVRGAADLQVLDVLARLLLLTRRCDAQLEVVGAGGAEDQAVPALAGLLALTGLDPLLRPADPHRPAERSA